MWSVGALLELDDRAKMEEFARTNFELDLPPIAEGSQDTIFEFLVSEGGNWFIPNSDFTSRRSWRGFSVPYCLNTCFPIETNEPTEQNKQTNKKTRNKQNQNDDLRLSRYYRRSECVVVVRYCLSLKWVNVSLSTMGFISIECHIKCNSRWSWGFINWSYLLVRNFSKNFP